MERRVEALTLTGAAGALEARVDWPATPPRGAALLCHPHPQHGGSMHTKALHRACRAFVAAGLVTLRFNFRGVGRSAGSWSGGAGELQDARVAWEHAASLLARGALVIGGFSFGAWIALRLGSERTTVPVPSALCGIAPPLDLFDFQFLDSLAAPMLLVAGDADPYCPAAALAGMQSRIGSHARVVTIPGAGHLFLERLEALERTLRDFARDVAQHAPGAP